MQYRLLHPDSLSNGSGCVTPAGETRFLSIRENPIPLDPCIDPFIKDAPNGVKLKPHYKFGNDAIRSLSLIFQSLKSPFVVWIDPEMTISGSFTFPESDLWGLLGKEHNEIEMEQLIIRYRQVTSESHSWSELLDAIKKVTCDYHIIHHEGFVEIAWADRDREQQLRESMNCEVPPIYFSYWNPLHLLSMWHEVSGMDLWYDESLLRKSWGKMEPTFWKRNAAVPLFWRERQFKHSRECESFFLVASSSLNHFMNILSSNYGSSAWQENNHWIIGSFRKDDNGLETIRHLLIDIRDDQYGLGMIAKDELKTIGLPVLTEAINFYEQVDEYTRYHLIDILCTIDNVERDEFFLNKLSEYSEEKCKSEGCHFSYNMMDTLIKKGNKKLIPILMKAIQNGIKCDSYLRIGLNCLGAPLESTDSTQLILMSGEMRNVCQQRGLEERYEILIELIDQCLHGYPPFLLGKIYEEQDGIVEFIGSIIDFNKSPWPEETPWMFRIGIPNQEEVPVYAEWCTGPDSAAGYQGQAVKTNNRWLMMEWGRIWMS